MAIPLGSEGAFQRCKSQLLKGHTSLFKHHSTAAAKSKTQALQAQERLSAATSQSKVGWITPAVIHDRLRTGSS